MDIGVFPYLVLLIAKYVQHNKCSQFSEMEIPYAKIEYAKDFKAFLAGLFDSVTFSLTLAYDICP